MERIRSFRKYELEIETKRGQLSTIRLDASSLEGIKQLKGSRMCFRKKKSKSLTTILWPVTIGIV